MRCRNSCTVRHVSKQPLVPHHPDPRVPGQPVLFFSFLLNSRLYLPERKNLLIQVKRHNSLREYGIKVREEAAWRSSSCVDISSSCSLFHWSFIFPSCFFFSSFYDDHEIIRVRRNRRNKKHTEREEEEKKQEVDRTRGKCREGLRLTCSMVHQCRSRWSLWEPNAYLM